MKRAEREVRNASIRESYLAGSSTNQFAAELGMSHSQIANILRHQGVALRPLGRRHRPEVIERDNQIRAAHAGGQPRGDR